MTPLVSTAMLAAAAHAIAGLVDRKSLGPDYIIPSIFNPAVARAVAEAVSKEAVRCGAARRHKKTSSDGQDA